jgi:hypothetical protein
MIGTAAPIIFAIALLALFLISVAVLKYAVQDTFMRTRLLMTALFFFIVLTLTISFWRSVALTLPYTLPAFILGILLGYFIGVHTERQKIMTQGMEHYMEHFAHIKHADLKNLTWWSIVNYYSIMGALILINLVGFTNVILDGSPAFVIITSVVGASLIGSILPYLAHLWTVPLIKKMQS